MRTAKIGPDLRFLCIKRGSRVHVRFFCYVSVDTSFAVVVLVIFVSFNASSTPMCRLSLTKFQGHPTRI